MSAHEQTLLTRFFIFEPHDETLVDWKNVGSVLAHDKEAARNKHYRDRGLTEPVRCCVVSENQWKPELWTPKIVRPPTSQPLAMPTVEPTAEPEAQTAIDSEPELDADEPETDEPS